MKRFFNTYLNAWYTSDDGLSWYEEKPQEMLPSLRDRSQGKPSRDRKAQRENKRQS